VLTQDPCICATGGTKNPTDGWPTLSQFACTVSWVLGLTQYAILVAGSLRGWSLHINWDAKPIIVALYEWRTRSWLSTPSQHALGPLVQCHSTLVELHTRKCRAQGTASGLATLHNSLLVNSCSLGQISLAAVSTGQAHLNWLGTISSSKVSLPGLQLVPALVPGTTSSCTLNFKWIVQGAVLYSCTNMLRIVATI